MENIGDACICFPFHLYYNPTAIFHDPKGISPGDIISRGSILDKDDIVFSTAKEIKADDRWIILSSERTAVENTESLFPEKYVTGMKVYGGEIFQISKNMYEKNKNEFELCRDSNFNVVFIDSIENIPGCVVAIK